MLLICGSSDQRLYYKLAYVVDPDIGPYYVCCVVQSLACSMLSYGSASTIAYVLHLLIAELCLHTLRTSTRWEDRKESDLQ